jgi:plasmid stability protein
MLICVRTTLNLPDSLAEEAKERAATEGRTLTSLVEEGLRMVLAAHDEPVPHEPLPTHSGGRLLVDLEDKEALWAILDADGFK